MTAAPITPAPITPAPVISTPITTVPTTATPIVVDGQGNYYFNGFNFGKQTVDACNGTGKLYFNAIALEGVAMRVTNTEIHANTTYVLNRDDRTYWLLTRKTTAGILDAAGTNLEIKQISDTGANIITVQGFRDGLCGINLGVSVQQPGNFSTMCGRFNPEACEVIGTDAADIIALNGSTYNQNFTYLNIEARGGNDVISCIAGNPETFLDRKMVILSATGGDGDDILIAKANFPGNS